jgi:ribonuclease HII
LTSRRSAPPPGLDRERALLEEGFEVVAGIDEVGRGAWAGPVMVGVVAVRASTGTPPGGVRDSKELGASRREQLEPAIESWCLASSVGAASAAEVDERGIIGALRAAAMRAIGALGIEVGAVLLDGTHDYLTSLEAVPLRRLPRVVTVVRGDRSCASIASASILAKAARDRLMVEMEGEHPDYGFARNKGYGTAAHADAVRTHGLSPLHRATWSFAGLAGRARG